MNLALLFDHRFFQDSEGQIFSKQNYTYDLFARRYLQVFDRVRIFARVAIDTASNEIPATTVGERVEIVSLGDWQGATGFWRNRWQIQRKLSEELRSDEAVIMIAPGAIGAAVQHSFARMKRPFAVEVVGDPYEVFAPGFSRHPARRILRWWMPKQLRQQCARAAAVTYVTSASLQRRYPPGPDAYVTSFSDVELSDDALVAKSARPSAPRESLTLITVGSLSAPYKSPELLIDAVALCCRKGHDLRLVIVGDGKNRALLEARARSSGLDGRVVFAGQLPAGALIREQLDRADLFVLPSKTEGLPRAMVEAMARGLPCIGTAVGGIPELLPYVDLVPPRDAAALAQKISEVISNPDRMAEMGARNLARAKDFRSEILHQRRLAFYEAVKQRTASWQRTVNR